MLGDHFLSQRIVRNGARTKNEKDGNLPRGRTKRRVLFV